MSWTRRRREGAYSRILLLHASALACVAIEDRVLNVTTRDSGVGGASSESQDGTPSGGSESGGSGAKNDTGGGGALGSSGSAGDGVGGSIDAAPEAGAADDPGCVSTASCDGFWTGTTTQDRQLRFEIRSGALAMVWFDWSIESCGGFESMNSQFTVGPSISTSGEIASGTQEDAPVSYALTGRFAGTRRATGELLLGYSQQGCVVNAERLEWQAFQNVCGDGRVDWPETCEGVADCQGCQLPVTNESEDNGVVAVADGPVTSNAVFFGTASGGDRDLFEVVNNSAVGRQLRLAVHGSVMGICGVDPLLLVFNENNDDPIAAMPRGGLGECPEFTRTLQAGTRFFVGVESENPEQPLPGYLLHIDFQE